MRDLTEYTEQELNKFWSDLIINIHTEFCVHGRTQAEYDAGMAVMMEIGGRYEAKQD